MPYSVERGLNTPESQTKIVDQEMTLPDTLKDTGVKAVETAYKANVQDGAGMPMVTPTPNQVTITIPSDQQTLTAQAKGPIESAATWLAKFWLRAIKRAVYFGWKIVTGGQNAA